MTVIMTMIVSETSSVDMAMVLKIIVTIALQKEQIAVLIQTFPTTQLQLLLLLLITMMTVTILGRTTLGTPKNMNTMMFLELGFGLASIFQLDSVFLIASLLKLT